MRMGLPSKEARLTGELALLRFMPIKRRLKNEELEEMRPELRRIRMELAQLRNMPGEVDQLFLKIGAVVTKHTGIQFALTEQQRKNFLDGFTGYMAQLRSMRRTRGENEPMELPRRGGWKKLPRHGA